MKAYESKTMDGEVLRLILISGSNFLFNNYPDIDALNVFPVPDGDTGTNMNLTLTSGAKEIMNIRNDKISEVGKLFSRGLLMGARGNSGVILSQIFRGFVLRLENKDNISVAEFAECWMGGAEMAYT
jgi:dihydroxyacetone kinase-like predicted kinase